MRTGRFNVDRIGMGAEQLKAIKRGRWPLEQLQAESERLFGEAVVASSTFP